MRLNPFKREPKPILFCSTHIPNWRRVRTYLRKSEKANRMSNFGPLYHILVERLRVYLQLNDNKGVVLTSSGHTALMAAYGVLGTKKAVVSNYTFKSTRSAALIQNIKVKVIDHTWPCLHPVDVQELKDDYDTLVVTCALSIIPDLGGLQGFCKSNNKKLIVDGAATFGTGKSFGGHSLYNYGDAFCLSFHATKSFPVGEMGVLIVDDDYVGDAKDYINFGKLNAKVSEYQCAIALSLLDEIGNDISRRREILSRYESRIFEPMFFSAPGSDTVVYSFLPIYLSSPQEARLIGTLLADNKIEYMRYYKPLVPGKNAQTLYDKNICLPCHPKLTNGDVDRICDIVAQGQRPPC